MSVSMMREPAARSNSTAPAAIKRRRPRMQNFDREHCRLNIAGQVSGGNKYRGKLPIPERAHPLVKRLWREMNAQRAAISEVAQRAGLARQSMTQWAHRTAPNLACIEAAFNVLGLKLVVVPEEWKL